MRKTILFLLFSLSLTGCSGYERIGEARETVVKSVSEIDKVLKDNDNRVNSSELGYVGSKDIEVNSSELENFGDNDSVVNSFDDGDNDIKVNSSDLGNLGDDVVTETSFPVNLEFTDEYKSLINNSLGDLLFVNESEFSSELSSLFISYLNTSCKTGIVSIVENNELIESFYYSPTSFISVLKDDSVLKSNYDTDSLSWICRSGISGFDYVEDLEYSMSYDSGFDFLLSSDRCIFSLTDFELLETGDTVFTSDYLYIGGESGVMRFVVSSDGYLKEISKEFKNRSKVYSIIYSDSVEDFESSLSDFGELLLSVESSLSDEIYSDMIINK